MKVIIHHIDQNAHAILRFSNLEIVGLYDEREELNKKDIHKLLGINKSTLVITNDFDSLLTKPAEMLITTGEGLYFTKKEKVEDWKKNVEKAIKKGLDIYNMSKILYGKETNYFKKLAKENNVKFIEASDNQGFKKFLPFALEEKEIKAKVINFTGTGMNTGKVTAMMILKNELEKKGIKVGVVGTEPSSIFFGADEQVIPEIYPTNKGAPAIFGAIKKIDKEKNPEIILVGNQTGLKASVLDAKEARAGAIVSYQILLGSKPDKIVLCTKWDKTDELDSHLKLLDIYGLKVAAIIINGKDCGNINKIIKDIGDKYNILCLDILATPNKIKNLIKILR